MKRGYVFALAVFLWPTNSLAAGAAGQVASVIGRATVTRNGQITILWVGDAVWLGDRIKTGADGRIKLTLADRSTLALGPNGDLQVTEFLVEAGSNRQGWFQLWSGRLRAVVSKWVGDPERSNFRFATPTAVAGVRGTDLLIDVSSADTGGSEGGSDKESLKSHTQVAVIEGEVEVTGSDGESGKQILTEGKMVDVPQDAPPTPPRPMTPEQRQAANELEQFGHGGPENDLPLGDPAQDAQTVLAESDGNHLDVVVSDRGYDATLGPPISQQPGDVRRTAPVTVEIRRVD